jgi:DNA repair exonuclease SbcCD nuclease subunit
MYSDLHLRPERLDTCKFVLDWIKDRVLKFPKNKKVIVVNGGDTFNTRGIIPTSCLDVASRCYIDWSEAGIDQWILVGNHDQEDRAGEIHPMSIFKRFGWTVVDRPMIKNDIALFPYMKKEAIEKSLKSEELEGIKTAIVHWGIQGAKRNDWNVDTDGVPIEWLERFDQVFSGHYHYRNSIQNVHYIGSPFQHNFGEMGQEKGVLIFDTESKEISFEEITGTPKHYEVDVEFKDGKKLVKGDKEPSANDFVRIRVRGGSESAMSFRKEDLKLSCASVKIEREIEEKFHSRLKVEDRHNILSLMEKYVDFVGFPGDKSKLLEIGKAFL